MTDTPAAPTTPEHKGHDDGRYHPDCSACQRDEAPRRGIRPGDAYLPSEARSTPAEPLDVLRVHRALCRRQGFTGHDNDNEPWPCEAFATAYQEESGDE